MHGFQETRDCGDAPACDVNVARRRLSPGREMARYTVEWMGAPRDRARRARRRNLPVIFVRVLGIESY